MAKKKAETKGKLAFFSGRSLRDIVGKSKYFIDTGNLATNFICSDKFIGGGIPGGKIVEIFGPPASAKSLWGYTLLGSVQKMGGIGVLIDCERAANPDFVERAGHCNVDELGYPEEMPVTLEDVGEYIINTTKKIRKDNPDAPILFVWDSIGVNPCNREWKEVDLPENYTQAQWKEIVGSKEKPGERARAAGDVLRKLNPFMSENNTTLFIINQTRQKIGAMSWESDEITAGGGKALEFYAGLRLRTYASKTIEDKKRMIPIGVNLMVQNKKNRSQVPFLKTKGIQLYFAKGVNPLGGLLTTLINAGRVEKATDDKGKPKAGVYKVMPDWTNGTGEVIFRSSEERNDVPMEVILKYPNLIDAKDTEEIKAYLGVFADAIEASNSADTEEVDVTDQNESLLGIEE